MSFNSRYSESIKNKTKSDAKGLEKVIININFTIIDITAYLNTIFYGKGEQLGDEKNKRRRNPLDAGIIPVLDSLASIDFCELLDYINNQIGNINLGEGRFDPSKQPDDFFGKIKWRFQKTAFDVQTEIDGFYNDFNNLDSPDGKIGALRLLSKIRIQFANFTQTISDLSNPIRVQPIDPDLALLLDAFPQIKNIGNFVSDKLAYFNKYTDYRQISNEEFKKITDTVAKIRQYCVLIQSLNNPAGSIAQFGGDILKRELKDLLKNFNPQDIIPTLKKINETLKKIQNICNNIKNVIQLASVIIRVFSVLIFVFKVIIRFFKAFPAPNQFTTVGITNTTADALNQIQKKGPGTFEVRLGQISTVLDSISLLLNTLLPIINEIISKVNNLLASIQRCANPPQDLLSDIQNTIDGLQITTNELQAFLDNKQQNDLTRSTRSQLGQFTINIITEQVIEESFGLRRRYGVALNNQGIVQVQSQPTFASDDNVIINEVKLLLQQKGLIKKDNSLYTDNELATINYATAYLSNDDLNINPDLDGIDSIVDSLAEFNDDPEGSDLNMANEAKSFVGGLKRGRRLQRRARKAVLRERQRLNATLGRQTRQTVTEYDYEIKVYARIPPSTLPTFLIKTIKTKAETDKQALDIAKEEMDPDNNKNYRYDLKKLS